jgi:hypothetical protein
MRKTVLLAGFVLLLGGRLDAADKKEADSFIKIQAKGTLRTGLVAIGGETTGTTISTKNGTLELDFGKNKKLRKLAANLDKKQVEVTGILTMRKGVERGTRLIVQVTDLKAVGDKE